jgi:hypothetical protein
VDCGGDVVTGNPVASGFDMQSDARGTLEHPLAERAFKIASAMGDGVLMLQWVPQSEQGGEAPGEKTDLQKSGFVLEVVRTVEAPVMFR